MGGFIKHHMLPSENLSYDWSIEHPELGINTKYMQLLVRKWINISREVLSNTICYLASS